MPSLDVRDKDGTIFASADVRLVRKPFAEEFCQAVEEKARPHDGRASLVMDMAALSKATPPAAFYAMRQMKAMPLAHIAIVGGNATMRAMGRGVLRVTRFPSYGFFDSELDALAWLGTRTDDEPTAVRRTHPSVRATVVGLAGLGVFLLVRRGRSRTAR